MKKYFVKYYRDFGNTYNLAWAETAAQLAQAERDDWEQITRKAAESLCARENYARKTDHAFSGYADCLILPIDLDDRDVNWTDARHFARHGYIVEAI